MQFIFSLLQKVSNGLDANKAAKEAYAETLSHYHGFMVKNTFQMGLMAAPSSETMLPCLGTDKVCWNITGANVAGECDLMILRVLFLTMCVTGTHDKGNAGMGPSC